MIASLFPSPKLLCFTRQLLEVGSSKKRGKEKSYCRDAGFQLPWGMFTTTEQRAVAPLQDYSLGISPPRSSFLELEILLVGLE